MQFLRNIVDKQRKLYHAKDSKFHKVWPLFDALETFLFAPDFRAKKSGVPVVEVFDLYKDRGDLHLGQRGHDVDCTTYCYAPHLVGPLFDRAASALLPSSRVHRIHVRPVRPV